jgi:DNA-binding response OmpR family regulator
MILAYEATPEPSVLLAGGDSEPMRLLAIVLEGFGYHPLECRQESEAVDHLEANLPCAALVYLGLKSAGSICELLRSHEQIPLVVLVDGTEEDPESHSQSLGASHWDWVDAPADRILKRLRQLVDHEGAQTSP